MAEAVLQPVHPGVLAGQLDLAAGFLDVGNPAPQGDYTMGILTGCATVPANGENTPLYALRFDYSQGQYQNHPPLWRARGINPERPVSSVIEFEGRDYAVGASFEWDAKGGDNGRLTAHLTQLPMRPRNQDLESSRRLSNIL